ncbi:MAG: DUF2235 domain-containing protein [Merismopedia sp. SIO2A8]|nr:DUF2235 domain-containing protein [Merismopedia sp. SIO2A8]
MKRLIVCCDGTWQQLRSPYPTNVVKIAQAVQSVGQDGVPQVVLYDEGVGTGDWRDRLRGGAFGIGLDQNIQDAYRFLCWNYDDGDEIYLFGFSRGAYTVRSLAGLIAQFGLLSRRDIRLTPQAYAYYRLRKEDRCYPQEQQKAEAFQQQCQHRDVPITLLGCWDTVGSLGVPNVIPLLPMDRWINRRYRFHNVQLSPTVRYALHAVAVDEIRDAFNVTPMERVSGDSQPLKQIWFPGEHGCVGGGARITAGLSDRTLCWMIESIRDFNLGLTFDIRNVKQGVHPDHWIDFDNRPKGIFALSGRIRRQVSHDIRHFDRSVIDRWRDRQDYRPQNLAIHRTQITEMIGF